jgi:7-cyano-7-deazaguanine synthase
VLISGGLDSSTVLAMAIDQGYDCFTLAFDYGQRCRAQLDAADRVSVAMGAGQHKVVTLNLRRDRGYSGDVCSRAQYRISLDSIGLG